MSKYISSYGTKVCPMLQVCTMTALMMQVNITIYLFCYDWYKAYIGTMMVLYLMHQVVTLYLYYEYYLLRRAVSYLRRPWLLE